MSGLYPVVSSQSGAEQFAQTQDTLASLQDMIETDVKTISDPTSPIADKVKAFQDLSGYINGTDSRWDSLNGTFSDEQKACLQKDLTNCLSAFNDVGIYSTYNGHCFWKWNGSAADIMTQWSTFSKDQQANFSACTFRHVDASGNVVPFDFSSCFNDFFQANHWSL